MTEENESMSDEKEKKNIKVATLVSPIQKVGIYETKAVSKTIHHWLLIDVFCCNNKAICIGDISFNNFITDYMNSSC